MMAIECDYHPSWQQIVLLIAVDAHPGFVRVVPAMEAGLADAACPLPYSSYILQ